MSPIELRLTAKPAMADALPVARALPRRERRFVGPFCFLDHFGPHQDVGRADGGVAPHPHIGLATVTYLFDGAILHHDSLGTAQRITQQWAEAQPRTEEGNRARSFLTTIARMID